MSRGSPVTGQLVGTAGRLPDSPMREVLQRIVAEPQAWSRQDPSVVRAWQAVSAELLELLRRVDEIDPVVKVLTALVAGFHGVEPDVDTERPELFALGAAQRARLERLEEEVNRLVASVEQLQSTFVAVRNSLAPSTDA